MGIISKLIEEQDRILKGANNKSNYDQDERLFTIYQKSGFCLWHGTFRAYCKKHGLHRNYLQLPN